MQIQKGDKAPDFTLQNTSGDRVSLYNDLIREKKKSVLLFFPLAFSGVCTDELCTVRDNLKFYNSMDANVIAISVDSFFTLSEFKKANNLQFPLLSDFNKEVSASYGVLYQDFFGMKGVSKRSAFIVDQDATILYAEVLEDSGNQPDFKSMQKILMSGS
ncbi:MAG: redoxin domain-containing protein [Bacteroidetes bacterium]|jgi:peroxiredoxin|nr:redoxin domain-containing protein [Bacteroidota bacterium]